MSLKKEKNQIKNKKLSKMILIIHVQNVTAQKIYMSIRIKFKLAYDLFCSTGLESSSHISKLTIEKY